MKVTRRPKKATTKIKKGSLVTNAAASKKPKMDNSKTPKQTKDSGKKISSYRVTRSLTKSSKKQTRQLKNEIKKDSATPAPKSQSKNVEDDKIYDFDQVDEDELKLVLFPKNKNEENKVKGARKYTGIKRKRSNDSDLEEEKKAKISKRTLRSKDGNVKLMFEKLNENKVPKRDQKGKEKKQDLHMKENRTVVPVLEKQRKSDRNKSNGLSKDNGVLDTPILRSKRGKLKSIDDATQKTSTPSQVGADTKKVKSTPKELEVHIMPSPMLSPVMNLSPIDFSPKKHQRLERIVQASSPDFKSPRPADRTYTGRGSIGRFPASPILMKANKKSSSTKNPLKNERRKSSKYEDWALKMSLELEDAESYELSVED